MGLNDKTKQLIIHADDAGLSHSENMATMQAMEKGIVNSYSIMVPCPWFYEIGIYSRNNPQYDCGIHLTLTCEWENYRFGPVLPVSEVPSLVDNDGYFFKKRDQLRENAAAEDVEKELRAQIVKAIRFGIKPTHIDAHMYSVASAPEFFKIYRDLGKQYNLPVLISRPLLDMVGLDPESTIEAEDFLIDQTYVADVENFENEGLIAYYNSILDNLGTGLNLILIHPAFDNEEMKGVTVNHPNFGSEWRQFDFNYFTDPATRIKLEENNIELITWRDVKTGKIPHG